MTAYVQFVGAILLALSFAFESPVLAQVRQQSPELPAQQPSSNQAPERPSRPTVPPSRYFRTPPDLAPDLIIASGTVAMNCEPDGSRRADFNVTVKNQSSTATADMSGITWQIIVAADWWPVKGWGQVVSSSVGWVKPLEGGPMALKPGEQFTTPLTITGLPQLTPENYQEYGFELTADPMNGVLESNEDNNQMLLYVTLDKNCVKVN